MYEAVPVYRFPFITGTSSNENEAELSRHEVRPLFVHACVRSAHRCSPSVITPPPPTHKCRARHAVAPKSLIIIIISPLFSIISIVNQMSRAEPSQAAPVTQQVTYVTLPAPLQAAEEATCRPPPPRQVGLWHIGTLSLMADG